MKKLLMGILFLFILMNKTQAQQTNGHYFKVIVEGIENREQAQQIESFIRLKEGVLFSQMRLQNSSCLVVFNDSIVNIDNIIEWLESFELTIGCSIAGETSDKPIPVLRRASCE